MTTRLYRADATYRGYEGDRRDHTAQYFLAESDEAAERFAQYVLAGWTESDITVGHVDLVAIPANYQAGDLVGYSVSTTFATFTT